MGKITHNIDDRVDELLVDRDTRILHARPALRDVALCASRRPPLRTARSPRSPPTPGPVTLSAMRELPAFTACASDPPSVRSQTLA
jgi:hypothetical protein